MSEQVLTITDKTTPVTAICSRGGFIFWVHYAHCPYYFYTLLCYILWWIHNRFPSVSLRKSIILMIDMPSVFT